MFDNPGLVVACVVGDGEAETGPLATAWHSNKFLNPATDGAVLPILHLNGYKISNPTILARITARGAGAAAPRLRLDADFVEGHEPALMHEAMAAALDTAVEQIKAIQARGPRRAAIRPRPRWPMIVLDSPKGWTGPKVVDGLQDRGHLPLAPGAALRSGRPSGAPQAAGGLAAELPARRSSSTRGAG